MAQNNWINVTVDPAAAKKADNTDHRHTVAGGTAAAFDATFSYDSAKITSVSMVNSVMAAIRQQLMGQLPK